EGGGRREVGWRRGAGGRAKRTAGCRLGGRGFGTTYRKAGPAIRFVRVGTMDNPDVCPPDIHIFTSSKQPWVTLPAGSKAVAEFYDLDAVWSAESLKRRQLMRAKAP